MILRHVKIDFDSSIVLGRDHRAHTDSCLWHLKVEMDDLYTPLGGLPSTITVDNTKLHQLWWTDQELDFEDLGQQLGMKILSISSICQPPGCVMPWHRDSFFRIKNQSPRDANLVRANINLKDAAIGHFIQYEWQNQLATFANWTANQGLLWDGTVPHLGANVGFEDKYTLQVSGYQN